MNRPPKARSPGRRRLAAWTVLLLLSCGPGSVDAGEDADFAVIDWSRHRGPGHAAPPRLTRAEYRNTLRDLLGVDLRAGVELPEDGEGNSGFDNGRDSLSLSPAHLEHYFNAADRAIAGVFALAKPMRATRLEAEEMTRNPAKLKPLKNGVVLVHPSHALGAEVVFPADGWYLFRVGAAALGGKPCVVEFRVGAVSVAAAPVGAGDLRQPPMVEAAGFVREGRHTVSLVSRNLVPQTPEPPDIVRIIEERARKRAPRLEPLSLDDTALVREIRDGLNTKAWGVQECIEWLRFLGPGGDSRKIDLRRVYLAERRGQWAVVRDRLAGESGVPADEIERRWREQNRERLADNERVVAAVAEVRWEDWMRHQGKLFIDRFEVAGPVRRPRPGEGGVGGWTLLDALAASDANPETVIRKLLPRAFRRPVSEAEADRYVGLLRTAQRREELREDALAIALTAVLTSPRFLFRDELPPVIEPDRKRSGESGDGKTKTARRALDDHALASRLSYFLWQSMPDAELFDLADSGLLSDPGTLAAQAERMLDDPRADAFFAGFADDWLGIRRLGRGISPDRARFPAFTPALAVAMKGEAARFVGSIFRGDRPLTELIDSPVAMLNEPLARHYGVEGVEGEEFRAVALSDPNRGGVLGLGAVLAVTSPPTRTNPARRGAWVLERILGQDPVEALPAVCELPGDVGEARSRTPREELALHRAKAECARCHGRMDPLGFGLQNFDAAGRWRDLEAGKPVDARGWLPGGGEFSGPAELKRLLRDEHGEAVVRNLTRRLLAYALGRELRYFDKPLVDEIVAAVESAEGSSRRLIREIVRSEAFRFQARADGVEGVTGDNPDKKAPPSPAGLPLPKNSKKFFDHD